MATYKFDAISRYGKFFGELYKATDAKPQDLSKGKSYDSPAALAAFLNTSLEKLDEDEDSVIWRNNSYEDFEQLVRDVSRASY